MKARMRAIGVLAGVLWLATAATAGAQAAKPAAAPAAAPKIDNDTFYALGAAVAQNLGSFELTQAELEQVQQGLQDSVLGKPLRVKPEDQRDNFRTLGMERQKVASEREKVKGQAFRDAAAKKAGVDVTVSGLIYEETKAGTGPVPAKTDRVTVHYKGTLIDGTEFDSSYSRGEPATFPLSGVVPCWTEGLQKMKAGGKAKLVCPPEIGYGDRGAPPKIKPGATLVFEVELIEIAAPEKAPPAAAVKPGMKPAGH